MSDHANRRVHMYDLLRYASVLKQLASFKQSIVRCNFDCNAGWGVGKPAITSHDLDEFKPDLSGVTILGASGYTVSDHVVLTEDQYKDYTYFQEADNRTDI